MKAKESNKEEILRLNLLKGDRFIIKEAKDPGCNWKIGEEGFIDETNQVTMNRIIPGKTCGIAKYKIEIIPNEFSHAIQNLIKEMKGG